MEFADAAVNCSRMTRHGERTGFAPWEALAEPSRIFAHPQDVLAAGNLTRGEKRAILASWASDAWAVEASPALRHCPGLPGCQVSLDEVLAALKALDPEPAEKPTARRARLRPIWFRKGMSTTLR
jgi:hypothetical protein